MKKFLFLAMLCCIASVSCTRIERIPVNENMTLLHNKWKDLYGVEINYKEALPIEYDSISNVIGSYNDNWFIAYKPDKQTLFNLRGEENPPLREMASGSHIEFALAGLSYIKIITDENGKKTVFGKTNGYEPFDEVYPAIGGYIFEKDGLFGYNDIVPPKYKKITIIKTWTDKYLFSEDGKTYSVCEYKGKRFKKVANIPVATVEEFGEKYANIRYSPYSFMGTTQSTPYKIWEEFYDKLDGR